MTHLRRARSRPNGDRWLRAKDATWCLSTAVVAALAACSGAVGPVRLPPKSRVATPTPILDAKPTQRQRVLAALAGYTAALHAADLSRNAARARGLLRPYLAVARIPGVVQTERAIWAKGEMFYGTPVLHVLSVRIDGRHAFVHDCDNTSAMGLLSVRTGAAVPGTAGVPDDNIVTRLDLVRGHWVVVFQLIEDVSCAA
ncbi:MAG: hypothetical protein ACLQFR_22710 [Streptosporangiaceae bacterium]